jgi:hypothetical protein
VGGWRGSLRERDCGIHAHARTRTRTHARTHARARTHACACMYTSMPRIYVSACVKRILYT